MEVVGRHALLFDDDATSAFVNSRDALVEWNSLLIDRYDVRHLLQSPPPPPLLKRHRQSPPPDSEEYELDQLRYQDLPPPPSDQQQQGNGGADVAEGGTYNAVSFSYGNTDVSFESKDSDVPCFLPPFLVPESLLQSLPPTEKLHQIIARTAIFVSEHGGQSEIVLRVKQGNNPTFGFLMPDHHLHAYFRFLVDSPEVLKSDKNTKPEEFNKADPEQKKTDAAGEALSLLGSVYGSGEDEDGAVQIVSKSGYNESGDALNSNSGALDQGSEQAVSSLYSTGIDDATSLHPLPVGKGKGSLSKKTHSVSVIASGTSLSKKKEGNKMDSRPRSLDKTRASTSLSESVTKPLILEPPSEIKRIMDKIVEFIQKNGKEFEAVLIEQDRTNGRFPFLLPSNQYHPYYLKIVQESMQASRSSTAYRQDLVGHVSSKRSSLFKENDSLTNGSASLDLPFDPERKEKFKMVITGSKKDAQEPAPKVSPQQCGMSVDAVAAILQAATRGLRNPKHDMMKTPSDDSPQSIGNVGGTISSYDAAAAILKAATKGRRSPKLDIQTKTPLDDQSEGIDNVGGATSNFDSTSFSSQLRSSTSKPISKEETTVSLPVELSRPFGLSKEASGIVAVDKGTAKTSASEADLSEASLTKEQKLKAERLKRAKMFAAILKSGAVPQATELVSRLSAEPPDIVVSSLVGAVCKVPNSSNILGREREGSSVTVDVDKLDRVEKYRKMNSDDDYKERRSRKRHHSRSRMVEEEDDEEEKDYKHSRKKHHSHHSSHKHRHRRRHSSKDRESRHRHKYSSSSEDERHTRRSYKNRESHSEREVEYEENGGKLLSESNTAGSGKDVSRETSLDIVNDRWEGSTPSVEAQPSDELRAKVRAMLLATM